MFLLTLVLWRPVLRGVGAFLVEKPGRPMPPDVIVLAGDFPLRSLEALMEYREGKVKRIYFTEEERSEFEPMFAARGLHFETTWDKNRRLFSAFGVPEPAVKLIPGQVLSTHDEAERIRKYAAANNIGAFGIITSKYHSHRACWIMRHMVPELQFTCTPSRFDKYNPDAWWHSRSDIMYVFSEYVKFTGYLFESAADRKLAD